MDFVYRLIFYLFMPVALFWVVGALLPVLVKSSRKHIDKSHWRSFRIGLVYVAILAALFVGLITLTRSTGLDFLYLLPILLMLVFSIAAAVGFTAVTHSLGARIFPKHSANKQIIYGTFVVLLASQIPYLGLAVLFPYLLIAGLGGAAISFNDWRKAS